MVSLVIVDDHVMLLESLASALRRRGHIVLATASSHAEGLRVTCDLRPDVCLLDRESNDSDDTTCSAVRAMRERTPGTRILLLSESARDRDIADARQAGAAGLMLKSSSVEAVSIAVATVDQGHGVWPEPLAVRTAGAGSRLGGLLTPREAQVLELLASGVPTTAIAAALGITVNTARTHVQRVLTKLGVSNRFQAAHLINGGRDASDLRALRRTVGE